MITNNSILIILLTSLLSVSSNAQGTDAKGKENKGLSTTKWENLLDPELSKWEKWLKKPLGLNNDPKNVYSVIQKDGADVLKITGEIFGGLTTLKNYSNYHLQMKVKWGDKKWPPRLNAKRDSGICYHSYGSHGTHSGSWKACLEFQVQEKDMGDFIPLGKATAMVRAKKESGLDARQWRYDSKAKFLHVDWYVHCAMEPDFPNGDWNTIDLYVIGDTAIHVVNGKVVCALKSGKTDKGEILDKGQIQIQSEAAEVFYKGMRIMGITEFPKAVKKAANF